MNLAINFHSETHTLDLLTECASHFSEFDVELKQLNTLISEISPLGEQVPPAPSLQNFNKEKSKMIMKLYESGVKAFQSEKHADAVKQFTVALEIVMRRAKYDLCQGTFLELALLLSSRADSYLKTREYLKAFNDADMVVGMMMLTPDNLLRRGVANFFLGNYEDAVADYARGLSFDENHERLKQEIEVCKQAILTQCGDHV